jgi:hypothetical protein
VGVRVLLPVLLVVPACLATPGDFDPAPRDVDNESHNSRFCDAGPEECAAADAAACAELVALTCEPTCAQSPACAAATLLSTYEPTSCSAALGNELTYPHCGASACETLVAKVCGGSPAIAACEDNPGCDPAQALHARSVDPEASTAEIQDALAACGQALEDESVFAPCP